jgi:hypothetical protein
VGFGAAGMGRVAPQQHNARGIRSPAYEPGPDSDVHEGGAVQFVDWRASFIEPPARRRPKAADSQRRLRKYNTCIFWLSDSTSPPISVPRREPNQHDNAMNCFMFLRALS